MGNTTADQKFNAYGGLFDAISDYCNENNLDISTTLKILALALPDEDVEVEAPVEQPVEVTAGNTGTVFSVT